MEFQFIIIYRYLIIIELNFLWSCIINFDRLLMTSLFYGKWQPWIFAEAGNFAETMTPRFKRPLLIICTVS